MFLDNVVTSTFVFEGDGRVQEYVGGYEDWLRQREARRAPPQGQRLVVTGDQGPGPARKRKAGTGTGAAVAKTEAGSGRQVVAAKPGKLSYKERRELDVAARPIEALEAEQAVLHERVAGPEFYKEGGTCDRGRPRPSRGRGPRADRGLRTLARAGLPVGGLRSPLRKNDLFFRLHLEPAEFRVVGTPVGQQGSLTRVGLSHLDRDPQPQRRVAPVPDDDFSA